MHRSSEPKNAAVQQSGLVKYTLKVRGKMPDRVFVILAGGMLGICLSLVPVRTHAAEDFAPFPPGENASLAKKTCTACHAANVVISTQFDEALALKQYKKYVGETDTDDARKVIKYLTTVLRAK
jgi:hypothetical protein